LSTELRTGIAASPGVAVGRAFVIDRHRIKIPKRHLPAEEVAGELVRLDEAVAKADLQLERLKRKLKETDVEQTGVIIEAYQLILHDEHLIHPTDPGRQDQR
jgi:phosphotransferase system enzyme I (PtsI)